MGRWDVLPGMNAGASPYAVPSPIEGSGTAWVLLGSWALSPARPTPIHPRHECRGFSALLVKKTKPKPHILWSFIEDERNTILKEYQFRSSRRVLAGGAASVSGRASKGIVTIQPSKTTDIEFRVLTAGYFAGRNDIDVVTEAIHWWKVYLDKIEAQAASGG